MMTKKVYAQYLIDDFKYKNSIPIDTPNKELNKYVLQNTSLGIGLEVLGDLSDEYKDYIYCRAGKAVVSTIALDMEIDPDRIRSLAHSTKHYSEYFDTHNLNVRELMDLLPE